MKTRKNKLSNFLKIGVFLLGISLFLYNCKQQEIIENTTKELGTVSFENALSYINNFSNKKVFKGRSKANFLDGIDTDKIKYEKLFNSEESITIIPAKIRGKDYYTRILLLKIDGIVESAVFSMTKNKANTKNNYSGRSYLYDIQGNFLTGFVIENDIITKKLVKNRNIHARTPGHDDGEMLDEVVVQGRLKRAPIYLTRLDRGGSFANGFLLSTQSGFGGENSTSPSWDFGGGNGSSNTNIDDQIINNLTGKAECIYDKLTKSSTDFKNAIKKFDGEFPVSHLKLVGSTSLSSDVNAETSPPSNYLITISINSNNLNRPNLSIARTIIHETIHAEMFRKILSILDNGGDLNGLTRNEWTSKLSNGDYPGIFDYYSRYGVNGMQHQQMAAHYISTISDYLSEFQPGLSQETYNSLAWVGLKGTIAWNSLTPSEKSTITNTINSFNNQGSENCN